MPPCFCLACLVLEYMCPRGPSRLAQHRRSPAEPPVGAVPVPRSWSNSGAVLLWYRSIAHTVPGPGCLVYGGTGHHHTTVNVRPAPSSAVAAEGVDGEKVKSVFFFLCLSSSCFSRGLVQIPSRPVCPVRDVPTITLFDYLLHLILNP